ncbi:MULTISPECIES: glycerate kinase [unclassified Cellulophaga]|uniref:glycerate kinase n=1 Tax=unclassified Cellulophaga TaxID=2634405 RepID=UPI000C2C8E67|nr:MULTISPECIES: glycerate kinase [unclassified Cellulophaga]MDO6491929.1 glycerate kinase [Cellulophaga sp. 2_MG-2023]MDO6495416.1 glycerate kinase [Cellulophaga sp. 3_MG-2023]PKB43270.1 glycerate kinase [Cellulophaga sp. RHA19]
MNYLVIPDKFKGSLTANEVIQSITSGLQRADKSPSVKSILASDGGDGFLDAVACKIMVQKVYVDTINPIGDKLRTYYLLNKDTKTAYVELAKASGLELLKAKERSAKKTSTFGTGLLIKDAIKKGATSIYLGLGGSATNDAGMGLAAALGYSFFNEDGMALNPIGENLSKVFKIERNATVTILNRIKFYAVNDVDNPLFGENGAAKVYAKQKGATAKDIEILDKGLEYFSSVIKHSMLLDHSFLPGAGAAGGTAFGLKTFFNAEFISGVKFLLELTEVPKMLKTKKIDCIITGEGKIDSQTNNGKLVKGVVDLARHYNIPVIAICGKLDADEEQLSKIGLNEALEIYDPKKGVDYSIKNAAMLVEEIIYQFFKNGRRKAQKKVNVSKILSKFNIF